MNRLEVLQLLRAFWGYSFTPSMEYGEHLCPFMDSEVPDHGGMMAFRGVMLIFPTWEQLGMKPPRPIEPLSAKRNNLRLVPPTGGEDA